MFSYRVNWNVRVSIPAFTLHVLSACVGMLNSFSRWWEGWKCSVFTYVRSPSTCHTYKSTICCLLYVTTFFCTLGPFLYVELDLH